MARYRKILTAIDGTAQGFHALRQSFKFARKEKCWITAICVAPPLDGDLEFTAVGNIRHALGEPCRRAIEEAKRIADEERALIKTLIEEGEYHERIIDMADAENCDLIVMGRSQKGDIARAVGSVTARVIGFSTRDVLVVPETTELGFERVLLATDGSRYSKLATERAIDFAASYGGRLDVISVVDVPDEFSAEAPDVLDHMVKKAKLIVSDIKARAEARGVSTTVHVKEGESAEVIAALERELKSDTVIMGSHGRTGIRRLLMGSVTEKVIGSTTCPVLIVK